MKLSLRWLLDHIASPQTPDIHQVTQFFIQKVAEIERVDHIKCPIDQWYVATLTAVDGPNNTVIIPELNKTVSIPLRSDSLIGMHYFVKRAGTAFLWVTAADVGSGKEGLFGPVFATAADVQGQWREWFEAEDWIFTVDNKSINHRPDLWGHRGIAREYAVLFETSLIPEKKLLSTQEVQASESTMTVNGIAIANDTALCSRFAAVSIEDIVNRHSDAWIATRLARVDVRPIDALVDATNYTMMDWGHPLHAFDTKYIADTKLNVTQGKPDQKIELLDGSLVTVKPEDIIITDKKDPLSLAGIMGGKKAAITSQTTSALVEAACFDAITIRRTSARLSKRTESSSRFEKSLDPAMAPVALLRFLHILASRSIAHTIRSPIKVLGALPKPMVLSVEHDFIEKKLGIALSSDKVVHILESLGFAVEHKKKLYQITIPSWRATKDIAIAEDIVEEIGRIYGYDAIPARVPSRPMVMHDVNPLLKMRAIKEHCSYGMSLKEVMTYAFFDETFLKKINWQPENALQVKEAVSDNWRRLATTLTPNLLKIIESASSECDALGIYEVATVWPMQEPSSTSEHMAISGIMADFKHDIDFYAAKQTLQSLFTLIDMPVSWQKIDQPLYPWYMPYQSARIMHGDRCVGIAGKVFKGFYNTLCTGDAFIWELDVDYITQYQAAIHRYVPASKYPRVNRDISMLVPRAVKADDLIAAVKITDKQIVKAVLVDFFEKAEWQDKKSITIRVTLENHTKTLTSAEVDTLIEHLYTRLKEFGAQPR